MEKGPAGQVRAEQAGPASTRSSVSPATPGVTQGSAGVMKVDQVDSVARQALRPISQRVGAVLRLLHKDWGLAGVAPWESLRRALGAFPLPAPPFLTKAHWFGPRWLPRACPVLQGPLEVVGE